MMAADTAAKRYSAMNITSPWRGLRVVPDATIPQGERQAVMFMYSGILAAAPAAVLVLQPGTGRLGPPLGRDIRPVGSEIRSVGWKIQGGLE